jgi:signal transduction histidine kinase
MVQRTRDIRERGRRRITAIIHWGVPVCFVGVLVLFPRYYPWPALSDLPNLIPWILLFAMMNLFPLYAWRSSNLAVDLPIGIAAALSLTPLETAIVAFLGAVDPKELKFKIPFRKALFNRSQAALSYSIASVIAELVSPSLTGPWVVVPLALLSLTIVCLINYVIVAVALAAEYGHKLTRILAKLRFGTQADFAITLVAWGVLGAMFSLLNTRVTPWLLLAFAPAVVLTRQALLRSQSAIEANEAFRSRQDAARQISREIAKERCDERRLIAANLHDEVLQPLFKVTLMAHVLRADIASGRLLALEEDIPELVTAAELASSSLRDLIGDLRRPVLGREGLSDALQRLVHLECRKSSIKTHCDTHPVHLDHERELVLYQIAKEALTNAVRHSNAENIYISLYEAGGNIELIIRDDGQGFDLLEIPPGHFGLGIMRERAAAIGAQTYIDSVPGRGTIVRVILRR